MFKQEKYMRILREFFVALCEFRTSNHPLDVKSKRYTRPTTPRFIRKCIHWNLNEAGNEYHFLRVRPFFKDMRIKYLPLKYRDRVNFIKLFDLLSCKDKQVMLNVSKYIKESLNYIWPSKSLSLHWINCIV